MKLRRAAQERQEELALDMKILEQLLEESRNEAEEMLQRKIQMKEEDKKYREYLQKQVLILSVLYYYCYTLPYSFNTVASLKRFAVLL